MKLHRLIIGHLLCGAVMAGGITINSIPKEQSQEIHVGEEKGVDGDGVTLESPSGYESPKPVSFSELQAMGDNQKIISQSKKIEAQSKRIEAQSKQNSDQARKIKDAQMFTEFETKRAKRMEGQLKVQADDNQWKDARLKWADNNLKKARTLDDPATPDQKFKTTPEPKISGVVRKSSPGSLPVLVEKPAAKQFGVYKEAP